MQPTSGPFTTESGNRIDGEGSWRDTKTSWKQKRPYDLSLPFKRVTTRTLVANHSEFNKPPFIGYSGFASAWTGKTPAGSYAYQGAPNWGEVIDCRNKALAKFSAAIASQAQMSTNFAEGRQAVAMIANRASQLGRFIRGLRRGNLVQAGIELGVDPTLVRNLRRQGKIRAGSKHLANTWLEFHFGWAPLIDDIQNACDVLSAPIKRSRVSGRATNRLTVGFVAPGNPINTWQNQGNDTTSHQIEVKVGIIANVSVANPNLHLASRLGLINPLTLGFELVPFSFILDWFVNVGQFLENMTEFAGLSITNACWTYRYQDTASRNYYLNYYGNAGSPPTWQLIGRYEQNIGSSCVTKERILGLPSVVLKVRPPWRLSPSRALTAVSLLVQQGIGIKPSLANLVHNKTGA